ncbi:MAG: hypothetical protein AAB873_03390 [Patescibacteria group bacterium]
MESLATPGDKIKGQGMQSDRGFDSFKELLDDAFNQFTSVFACIDSENLEEARDVASDLQTLEAYTGRTTQEINQIFYSFAKDYNNIVTTLTKANLTMNEICLCLVKMRKMKRDL